MRGNPRISVRVEKDTLAELSMRAEAEGISISELVRLIIDEYLDVNS